MTNHLKLADSYLRLSDEEKKIRCKNLKELEMIEKAWFAGEKTKDEE